jgi:hypothetical protein
MRDSMRFVRTAVLEPDSLLLDQISPTSPHGYVSNHGLVEWASRYGLGFSCLFGQTPLDPVLQWREQLISDGDVWTTHIAKAATVEAFDELARRLTDDAAWDGL